MIKIRCNGLLVVSLIVLLLVSDIPVLILSTDEKRIILISDRDDNNEIYVMDTDGDEEEISP